MAISKKMIYLLICGLLTFSLSYGEDCDRCEEREDSCPEKCECKSNNGKKPCGYNPMCRYYRYRTIYQHSCVREEYGDDPASSWPGRRDGNFSDELTR
ncbi:MAG: hypothetical protein AAGG81_02415 [Chlamydiota bacterium]